MRLAPLDMLDRVSPWLLLLPPHSVSERQCRTGCVSRRALFALLSCSSLPSHSCRSLGVVLYELMALKHPFDATSMEGLLSKIVKSQPPPLPKQVGHSD